MSKGDTWQGQMFERAVRQYELDAIAKYESEQEFKRVLAKARLREMERTEWSPEFEGHMRRRLLMGALRYGLLADKRIKGKKWDLLEPIIKKIKLYETTGNTEYLVDAANYCLLAFECDDHPLKHFKALDDHHDHCKLRTQPR